MLRVEAREPARWLPVWVLSATQLVSWGTLYYAFSAMLGPMRAETGWPADGVVGAFSVSLLATGAAAYPVGRMIQRFGGTAVMTAGSLLAATGLCVIASSSTLWQFYVGWTLAGLASAGTLYEPAFAVLANVYGPNFRRALTAVVLVGGFASTVFWPLTERLTTSLGWRTTFVTYAMLHLGLCAPLHWAGLPRRLPESGTTTRKRASRFELLRQPIYLSLTASFVLSTAVFAIISVYLISILHAQGFDSSSAAWIAALAGPAQVASRLGDATIGRAWKPSRTGTAALIVLVFSLAGLANGTTTPPGVSAIAVILYGLSNGVMTIVRSLSIADVFGQERYAGVSGAVAGPTLVARAAGPVLASRIVDGSGDFDRLMWILAGLILASLWFYRLALQKTCLAQSLPNEGSSSDAPILS